MDRESEFLLFHAVASIVFKTMLAVVLGLLLLLALYWVPRVIEILG